NDPQRDFAINAAEGQVVDFVSEGRDVGTLGGVDVNSKNVFSVEVDVRREIEGERRVSALVFAKALAVDPYSGGRHHTLEIDEDVLAAGLWRQLETAAVE